MVVWDGVRWGGEGWGQRMVCWCEVGCGGGGGGQHMVWDGVGWCEVGSAWWCGMG